MMPNKAGSQYHLSLLFYWEVPPPGQEDAHVVSGVGRKFGRRYPQEWETWGGW